MIKLFLRNKIVEVANVIYDNQSNIKSLGIVFLIITAITITIYLIGFIIAEPFYTFISHPFPSFNFTPLLQSDSWIYISNSYLFAGSITLLCIQALYYTGKTLTSVITWIISNAQLAINGIKVPTRW